MKKLLLVIAAVAMLLPSCKKINEELDALDARLDKLEQETIPTIEEQISAINTTLGNLDAMDKELKGYIDGLTATASNLQEQINATNTKIDEVESALRKEIEDSNAENLTQLQTAKSEVLAQLATAKTELENELKQINATIETLKEKDKDLDNKIAELRSYVDTELGETTDWVNATFATLEQYNSLVSEIATIKEQIKAINQSITNLETRLTTKINEDIANAVSTLNADIQQKVSEITDAYTNAVKTAKEEITSAYTTAIQTAITTLDNSLKTWVGEQLANYYTIAEVEAKITALQTAITEGDATLQEELSKLKSQLETTATEITAAYKKAIEEAINTNNGVIDTKIANEIASVNQRITNEVVTINAKIAEIESRLDNVEAKIAELLARIQSVSYIPTYDDGKATIVSDGSTSLVTLDFEVSPKDAVVELAKVWQSAVSVKAIYTQTRAVSFVDMPIVKFESDPVNGIVSVTASAENLSAEFFAGMQSASVRLSISDGNNSIASEYVPICATTIHGEDVTPQNYMIYYTTSDNTKLFPNTTEPGIFGSFLISNSYEEGQGILVFDAPITSIGESAFEDCTSLRSITIPDSVTEIGNSAFRNCTSLTSITIPNSVTSIGEYAFSGCTSLTSVSIPDSVTEIGNSAFRNCTSLTSVTIPNSVTSIGEYAFYGCTSLTSVSIPDSVTEIGNSAFRNCTSLTSVTIPNSVTSIGEYAFYGCTGELIVNCNICGYENGGSVSGTNILNGYSPFYNSKFEKITIGNSVTSIGYRAFYNCKSLTSVTIHNSAPSISSNAFYGCTLLSDVYVHITDLVTYTTGNTVSRIGDNTHLLVNGVEITELLIPYGIASIGNSAFRKCTSLTSVSIPDSVTSIGSSAFSNCTSLTSISIPDSVTSIGSSAFYGCTLLKEMYCKSTTPPTGSASMLNNNALDRKIYVPRGSVDAYKSAEYWSEYASYIEGYDF